ncbi:MAG: porin family protein [Ferruginibacter sp.]
MKKVLSVLFICGACYSAQSQKVYLQGGINLANITHSSNGSTEDNNVLTTFNAGLMTRVNTPGVIGFETGVLLTGRGSKAETNFTILGNQGYVKSTFNPLYVEVPLNLIFKIPLDPGTGIFFNAGPYIAMGVGGKSKVDYYDGITTSHTERKIEFANDDPFTSQQDDANYNKLKRFDYGINLGGGFKFNKLLLKANYGLGLAKINSTESNNNANDKNKFRTISFSVGFPLGL